MASEFFAEADVEFAGEEERGDNREIDQIIHTANMRWGKTGG